MTRPMKLTLGPILFNWEPDIWRDFYFRIADEAAVDAVAVGEVICSKRMPFFDEHFPAVLERLTAAGKEVLVSSLALVTLERERRRTEELARADEWLVEANDISCIAHLAGRPHVIGPFVNVYNEGTAQWFAAQGARRICLPPELPLEFDCGHCGCHTAGRDRGLCVRPGAAGNLGPVLSRAPAQACEGQLPLRLCGRSGWPAG